MSNWTNSTSRASGLNKAGPTFAEGPTLGLDKAGAGSESFGQSLTGLWEGIPPRGRKSPCAAFARILTRIYEKLYMYIGNSGTHPALVGAVGGWVSTSGKVDS